MNILLIEDDAVLTDGLLHTLGRGGYSVSCATTAMAAGQLVESQDFDLIVMDLGLPDMDGLQLLRNFRHRKLSLPILILTARDSVNDRIDGIEQGADDYLTKPFELRELEARIQALIRRCYGGFDRHIRIGRLSLDTLQQTILADGKAFILSAREYGVLEILMMQAGKVVAKDRIAQRLSNDGEGLSDNAIEINIHRLRKHLETYGVVIRTLRGLGYLLECADG
ncbi:MAG: response regulator [Methylovulum sp.]|uniref:response regulator n=1 Tax=Methylovulum sp. TaxID=1916980 RepID=UPI002604B648|nr:response regulator [Methylovulum sp.]MDD2723576.1 response regulator [Methylovulum sp.]MDD5124158.1 response regulator [Methylovulum sp.]